MDKKKTRGEIQVKTQADLMESLITESMKAVSIVFAKTMQDFQKEIRAEVGNIKNIITEQEIRHERQMEEARKRIDEANGLIGLRTKNVVSLTKLLKTKLSQLAGEEITAGSYYYVSAKEKLFRKYRVYHWEEFPIHMYNSVHADIDALEDIRDINFE